MFSHLLLKTQVVVCCCHGEFVLTAHKRTHSSKRLAVFSFFVFGETSFPPHVSSASAALMCACVS